MLVTNKHPFIEEESRTFGRKEYAVLTYDQGINK